MRRVLFGAAVLLPCLAQQAPVGNVGVITGTVQGEDGSPVAGAYVTLHLSYSSNPPVRQRPQTQWRVYSGTGGSFRFSGLRIGSYRLCAQAPATLWLDPCEWGLPIPSVALTGAAPSQTIAISMRKGVEVPIRIEDPGQHIVRNEGRTPGAHLLVGVRTPASTFRPAIPAGPGIGGTMLKVVIPFDRPVQLAVSSGFFKLADGSGEQVARPGLAIPLAVPAGQTPATVRVSVAGIR